MRRLDALVGALPSDQLTKTLYKRQSRQPAQVLLTARSLTPNNFFRRGTKLLNHRHIEMKVRPCFKKSEPFEQNLTVRHVSDSVRQVTFTKAASPGPHRRAPYHRSGYGNH